MESDADLDRYDELVGLIYEAAESPSLWPVLVEELSELLGRGDLAGERLPARQAAQPGQQVIQPALRDEMVELLVPHLQRAIRIGKKMARLQDERYGALAVVEGLPLGIVMVDGDGCIISANGYAEQIIRTHKIFYVQEGKLCFQDSEKSRWLHEWVQAAKQRRSLGGSETAGRDMRVLSGRDDNGHPLSLLVLPASFDEDPTVFSRGAAAILISVSADQYSVEESLISELFSLTRSEARIAAQLVKGYGLDDIEELLHVSKNTLRTHLKSIFRKTDTTRQAQLVQKLLSSPAIMALRPQGERVGRDPGCRGRLSHDDYYRGATITLADRRKLSFSEYGSESGTPVLWFHSILGSRYQRPHDPDLLTSLGVRLIVPERPGYGNSSPCQGRSFLDWAVDMVALLDYLDLKRVYVAGFSGGGPYALACAYHMPQRVVRTALISSTAPFISVSALKGMDYGNRLCMVVGHYFPALMRPLLKGLSQRILKRPELIHDIFIRDVASSDKDVLSRPEVQEHLRREMHEGMKNNAEGFVSDLLLYARPWGFDYSRIKGDVRLWHGKKDHLVPYRLLEQVQDLPVSKRYLYDNEGHFLLYDHWETILREFIHGH